MAFYDDQKAYEAAAKRIDDNTELEQYRDLITYDWGDMEAHWRWVASAPIAEIIEWAQGIREDEEAQKREEAAN